MSNFHLLKLVQYCQICALWNLCVYVTMLAERMIMSWQFLLLVDEGREDWKDLLGKSREICRSAPECVLSTCYRIWAMSLFRHDDNVFWALSGHTFDRRDIQVSAVPLCLIFVHAILLVRICPAVFSFLSGSWRFWALLKLLQHSRFGESFHLPDSWVIPSSYERKNILLMLFHG